MVSLWGPRRLIQRAPYVAAKPDQAPGANVRDPNSSVIEVDVKYEVRDKGLLLYNASTVRFSGAYTVAASEQERFFVFRLPEGIRKHEGLKVTVDETPQAIGRSEATSGRLSVPLPQGKAARVAVQFTTYGQDSWEYSAGRTSLAPDSRGRGGTYRATDQGRQDGRSILENFSLTIATNVANIDYPRGTQSPTVRAVAHNGGVRAQWQYDRLVTDQSFGMLMPEPKHAGPIAYRMSFFAPVSLFFFFTVLFTVVVLKKVPLHPMHYLFISAAFFAFHLLLAYLVDTVNIHAAFWICAIVSMVLVVSYMRLVAGVKFAVATVGLAQLVYLVGFSYAFFFPGKTGLTITIGAIATLFVLMQATGRVKWSEVFSRSKPLPPVPPVPTPAVTAPDAPGSQGT